MSIALTASAMPDEVAHAKQAGFLRHLSKPIVFAELEKAIKEVTSETPS